VLTLVRPSFEWDDKLDERKTIGDFEKCSNRDQNACNLCHGTFCITAISGMPIMPYKMPHRTYIQKPYICHLC